MSKILIILFTVLLIFLFGRLWVGSGSFPQLWHMQDKMESLAAANRQQKEENRKLEADLEQVQGGTEAIEARARSDFGMIRQGESFYQIILDQDTEQPAATPARPDTGKHEP